jgi:hypothetical protein
MHAADKLCMCFVGFAKSMCHSLARHKVMMSFWVDFSTETRLGQTSSGQKPAFGRKDILECAKRDEELHRRSIYTRTVVAKIRFHENTTARACFLSVGPEQSMSQRVKTFELSIMVCRGYKPQRKAHY